MCTPRKEEAKFSTPNKFGGSGRYKFKGNILSKAFDEAEKEEEKEGRSREMPTAITSKAVADLLKASPGSEEGVCFVECPFDFECDVIFGSSLNANGIIVLREDILPRLEEMTESFYELKCRLSMLVAKYASFFLVVECGSGGGGSKYPRATQGLQSGLYGITFLLSESGKQTAEHIQRIVLNEWHKKSGKDDWLPNEMSPQTLLRLKDEALVMAADIPQLNFLSVLMAVDYFKSVKQIRRQKDPSQIEVNARVSSFAAMLIFKKYHS